MKVILQQDVRGKGKKGQMVEVSDGYARNFLLPKKLAVAATADNINTMELQEKARKEREQRAREAAVALSGKLKDMPVHVKAKAGAGGRLFGSVTTKEISVALKEQYGVAVRPHQGIRRLSGQGQTGLRGLRRAECVCGGSVRVSFITRLQITACTGRRPRRPADDCRSTIVPPGQQVGRAYATNMPPACLLHAAVSRTPSRTTYIRMN